MFASQRIDKNSGFCLELNVRITNKTITCYQKTLETSKKHQNDRRKSSDLQSKEFSLTKQIARPTKVYEWIGKTN